LVPCPNLVLPSLEPPAHTFRALESCWHAGEGLPYFPVTSRGSSGAANDRAGEEYQVRARYQSRANALLPCTGPTHDTGGMDRSSRVVWRLRCLLGREPYALEVRAARAGNWPGGIPEGSDETPWGEGESSEEGPWEWGETESEGGEGTGGELYTGGGGLNTGGWGSRAGGQSLFSQESSQGLSQGLAPGFSQGMSQGMSQESSQGFGQGMTQDSSQGFSQGFDQDSSQGLSQALNESLSQSFSQGFGPSLSQSHGKSRGLSQGVSQDSGAGLGISAPSQPFWQQNTDGRILRRFSIAEDATLLRQRYVYSYIYISIYLYRYRYRYM